MQQLEALTREATALAQGQLAPAEAELARQMQICNACRYCEGFCAVFPAMTRRLDFVQADLHYLANLCHNCGACLHACQYAPPHEFAVNFPQAMAQVRAVTYQEYAWPPALGALYRRAGATTALALAAGLALFLVLATKLAGPALHQPLAGNFYAVFPHDFLAWIFGLVFAFALFALGMGARKFWSEVSPAADLPRGFRLVVRERRGGPDGNRARGRRAEALAVGARPLHDLNQLLHAPSPSTRLWPLASPRSGRTPCRCSCPRPPCSRGRARCRPSSRRRRTGCRWAARRNARRRSHWFSSRGR